MRTTDQLENYGGGIPQAGKYHCECVSVQRGKSQNKGTPFVTLEWKTAWGSTFKDDVYGTSGTIGQMARIIKRVIAAGDEEWPDKDDDCVAQMLDFIAGNIEGCRATVEIVEFTEKFVYKHGPKEGQPGEKTKRRVAMFGYTEAESTPVAHETIALPSDEEVPF